MSDLSLSWTPPGPVSNAFMASRAGVHGIMGPIGSGKTGTALMKCIHLAAEQQPSPRDGWRRSKFTVVHQTYRQLWRATIPSWWKWVPQSVGEWSGAKDAPARHTVRFALPDGSRVELIMDFVAIGDNAAEDVLRGYEPTGFYLNEADLLSEDVFLYARGRAGRYPAMADGGPSWWGIMLDFNAPPVTSWIYRSFFSKRPEGYETYVQPGGFDPKAENKTNLPEGYYEKQAEGQPDWYVQRMIENKFAYPRDGKPVYPEYNDQLHCAPQDLKPIPGLKLIIGLDAGLTPAGGIWQRTPFGQWRGLRELVVAAGESMGPTRFGQWLAQVLRDHYPGFEVECWADPSSFYGGDKQSDDDKAWAQIVAAVAKIRIRPAPSNSPSVRIEAVRKPLTRMIDGRQPGLIISPCMEVTREGMAAMYRFAKAKTSDERYAEQPEKNSFSHIADANQYALLSGGEYADVMQREQRSRRVPRQTRALGDDDADAWGGERGGGRQQHSALGD